MNKQKRLLIIKGPGFENIIDHIKNLGYEISILSPSSIDEDKIIDEIRSLPPQIRGRIRYGKGKLLPLTRSGHLNYSNTSIMLVYERDKLVDVYPKMLGSKYFSLLDGIRKIQSTETYLYEESLVLLLSQHPELINCSNVVKKHFNIEIGEVDLLLQDNKGEMVLVEVEEIIKDKAVAQIIGLKNKLKQIGISVNRLVLFGFDIERNAISPAKEVGVEIWLLKINRIV